MVVALVANVRLGVGAWDTWGGAEVLLGLSVLGSSKEEGVGAYYNILIRIEGGRERRYIHRGRVNLPVGARRTSWSRVRHLPPALIILALAVSVNLRAATVSLGTSRSLMSSVTVPTTTTMRSVWVPRCLTRRERDRGGLLTLEAMSLLTTVFAKVEPVLLARNLKSYTEQRRR